MNAPTREQIDAARGVLAKELDDIEHTGGEADAVAVALRVLLSAIPALTASRVEPGADVIERLAYVFDAAADAYAEQDVSQRGNSTLSGIRAVVVALAEMGSEALPSVREIQACTSDNPFYMLTHENGQRVRSMLLSRLAPVLGARRALELPSQEELARCIRDCGDGVDGTARAVLDLLRSRSAPPTDEQLANAAQYANDELGLEPAEWNMRGARRAMLYDGSPDGIKAWHALVIGHVTVATREGRR